jgi:hypothetical protein
LSNNMFSALMSKCMMHVAAFVQAMPSMMP